MSDRETFESEDAHRRGLEAGAAGAEPGPGLIESPREVPGHISPEKLDSILTEISEFEVKLEEDPTLPELGARYLQSRIAQCRHFLNRTQYYLQVTRRYEKNLKKAEKAFELDLELKIAGLLANDTLVRQQSAAQDRRALAVSMLKDEHENLAKFKVELQDLDGTIRIIKAKYDDLRHTNQDIKLQRQLVKDDRTGWESGEGGYVKPQSREDRTIPGGLPPPVRTEEINPEDLLDPEKRPEDLPEPKNASHAKQISNFFANRPAAPQTAAPPPTETAAPVVTGMSYEDLLK